MPFVLPACQIKPLTLNQFPPLTINVFIVKGIKDDVRCMRETLKMEQISNEFFDFHEKVNTILVEQEEIFVTHMAAIKVGCLHCTAPPRADALNKDSSPIIFPLRFFISATFFTPLRILATNRRMQSC